MTSPLLKRPAAGAGEIVSVTPDGISWKYAGLRIIRSLAGSRQSADTGNTEALLVMIEGTARIGCNGASWSVGKRATPFDGPPEALFIPPGCSYTIEAQTDCEIAICWGVAREHHRPVHLLTLTTGDAHERGTGNAQRRVYDILMDPRGSSTLFVTEVVTPPGHWSSYPPHKHDCDNPPIESQLEEIYYYRARPSAGFAFQRVYTGDGSLDETITAHDRDIVLVPRGYHVCAAAAEYEIYYLNVLAGPKHVYHMTFDPSHEWIKAGWTW